MLLVLRPSGYYRWFHRNNSAWMCPRVSVEAITAVAWNAIRDHKGSDRLAAQCHAKARGRAREPESHPPIGPPPISTTGFGRELPTRLPFGLARTRTPSAVGVRLANLCPPRPRRRLRDRLPLPRAQRLRPRLPAPEPALASDGGAGTLRLKRRIGRGLARSNVDDEFGTLGEVGGALRSGHGRSIAREPSGRASPRVSR